MQNCAFVRYSHAFVLYFGDVVLAVQSTDDGQASTCPEVGVLWRCNDTSGRDTRFTNSGVRDDAAVESRPGACQKGNRCTAFPVQTGVS